MKKDFTFWPAMRGRRIGRPGIWRAFCCAAILLCATVLLGQSYRADGITGGPLLPSENTNPALASVRQSMPVESANALLNQSAQQILFMENCGQVRDQHGRVRGDVLFLARSGGMKIALRANGLSYQFEKANVKEQSKMAKEARPRGPDSDLRAVESVESHRLDMCLEGANPAPEVVREAGSDYTEHYHNIPSVPEGITGVQAWTRIRLKEVYPGIDWVIYSQEGRMKYDFVVRPGADPAQIRMRYAGGADMGIDRDGALRIKTPMGEISEHAPVSYQDGREIPSRFVLRGAILSLAFTDYDPARTLIVDPALAWATYYGGSEGEEGHSTATDGSGNVYLGGNTLSTTGIASGGHQNTLGGGDDAFLVKFNAAGVRQWATYYGGADPDICWSIATDGNGNVYMGGTTFSTSGIAFGGHQNTFLGESDAFLVKFNTAGVRQWATYYGGADVEDGTSVATDGNGNVYLAGQTHVFGSVDIAFGGHQSTYQGDTDAFLVKFNAAGVRQWGTFYGGTGREGRPSTAVDGSGNVYLAGLTRSTTGIASGGHQNTLGGGFDAFLAKFNAAGVRQWGTYYGGGNNEQGESVAVDGSGDVYLAGWTHSTSGIAFGGHQNTLQGVNDAFLAKFNAAGVRQWATYYGGSSEESGLSTAVDRSGNVYLMGRTLSATGIASGGHQNTYGGGVDAFLVKFNAVGVRQWATYYGGTSLDAGYSVATDGSDNAYLAGYTSSTGIASGGHQNTLGGSPDAFLAKFSGEPCTAPVITAAASSNSPICQGAALNLSIGAAGTPPLTYAWSGTGTFSDASAANPMVTGAATGDYTVVVSNGCGSVTSTATVTVHTVAPAITTPVGSNSPICAGETLNLSVGVSGTAPLTYTWAGTGTIANGNTATPTVTGAATGTYTVTVTNGCGSTTGIVSVMVNPVPTVNVLATPTNATVCAGQNITLNATDNNDLTFDGANDYVNPGNITQMNGATQLTVEGMFYLTRRARFTTLFAKRLNDNNLFQVQYEGNVAPGNRLIFAISNNSAKAVGICPENSFSLGTWHHLAAVYDASGATKADKMKIYIDGVQVPLTFPEPTNVAGVPIGGPVPSSTANITSPLLLGTETLSTVGNSAVMFTGKMNDVRVWSTARTAAEIAASNNACLTNTTGLIAEYKFDEVSGASTAASSTGSYPASCVNMAFNSVWNGSSVGCGASTTFAWSGGITNNTPFAPVASGSYTVTATHPAGCTATQTVAVTVGTAPSITTPAASNSPICAGTTLNLSVGASGTAPLTYAWAGTGTIANGNTATPTVTGAATGTYTVTVTNGCGSVTNTVAVVVNAAPLITAPASSNSPICMGATLNLNVGASGTAPLAYVWTGTGTFSDASATNPMVTGATTGNYTVVVSNICGSVTSTATVTISAAAPSITTPAASNSPICAGTTLNLSVGASGTAPLIYAWAGTGTIANGNTATPTVTGAATGTYTVTVTNGCGSVTNTVAVAVSAAPLITAPASSNSPICTGATLNLNVGASSAAPLTYAWTGTGTFSDAGAANPMVTGAVTGNYTVVVSNTCGSVTSTASVVINGDNQPPVLTCPSNRSLSTAAGTCAAPAIYAPTTLDNCSSAPPALSHSFSGATAVALWATGSGSGSTFNKGITTVTLRATSAGGLTKTCAFRVVVNDMEAPTLLNCVNPPSVNAAANTCSAVVTYATPTFTDNCAPASGTAVRISGPASGSAVPAGNHNVIFQATDASGRANRCTITLTVVDNQPPAVICPPSVTVTGSGAPCTSIVFYNTPTASDNCAGALAPFLSSGWASGSVFQAGTSTNVWRAIAPNGQTGECFFTVTVNCGTARGTGTAAERTEDANTPNVLSPSGASAALDFRLSPNPASAEVAIRLINHASNQRTHKSTNPQINIFDVQGRLAWSQPVAPEGEQTLRVDVSDWAPGIYMVTLRGEGAVVTKRLSVLPPPDRRF